MLVEIGLVGYGDLVVWRHQRRGLRVVLLVAGLFEVWLVVVVVVIWEGLLVEEVVVVLVLGEVDERAGARRGGCGCGA